MKAMERSAVGDSTAPPGTKEGARGERTLEGWASESHTNVSIVISHFQHKIILKFI